MAYDNSGVFSSNMYSVEFASSTTPPSNAPATDALGDWIANQLVVPATSHRAYWRQRVNPDLAELEAGTTTRVGGAR